MELADLLPRLRQTIQFPLDPVDVYMGAFPPQLGKWFVGRVPQDLQPYGVAYRNMLRITSRQEIIHFNLTPPSKIDDWRTDNPDQPFWIRMASGAVCPHSKGEPFLLNESVRADPRLQAWHQSAVLLDTEIRHYVKKIYEVAPLFHNRTDIALAWPEAVQAVPAIISGIRISETAKLSRRQSPRIADIREEVAQVLPPDAMARLTEMLATATLLPSKHDLTAWIGYNKEEF